MLDCELNRIEIPLDAVRCMGCSDLECEVHQEIQCFHDGDGCENCSDDDKSMKLCTHVCHTILDIFRGGAKANGV